MVVLKSSTRGFRSCPGTAKETAYGGTLTVLPEAGSGVTHVSSANIPLERMLLFHLTEREAGIRMVGGEKLLTVS